MSGSRNLSAPGCIELQMRALDAFEVRMEVKLNAMGRLPKPLLYPLHVVLALFSAGAIGLPSTERTL